MCDGVLRSRGGPKPRPAVIVGGDGKVRLDVVPPIPAQARQIVTGNFWLVRDGRRVLDPGEDPPEPRTAVGIDRGGKILTILVADGRRPWAPGLSLKQTADVMVARGCVAAINFDGGGSTTLVVRDPESGEYETLNTPSDGRLRPVANALCIQVTEDSSAAAQPAP
jgi:exopolysaccharide biosynthesis protein